LQKNSHFKKNDNLKSKTGRVYWKDSIANNQIQLESYVPDASKKRKRENEYEFSMNDIISNGVSSVGTVKPIEDFKEMIQRRDVDLVNEAIDGMKKVILQLVNESILDQLYQKSIDSILALRRGCIQENETSQFNQFLKDMRKSFQGKRKDDFWSLIKDNGITLISSDESEDSEVSPKEAREFHIIARQLSLPKVVQKNDDIDGLLDQAD